MIKKISGVAALALCLTFAFASCADKKETPAQEQQEAAATMANNSVYVLVHDGHGQNSVENYVQVAVVLEGENNQTAQIVVSSPPENTQTSCSLQTTAKKISDTQYQTTLQGVPVNFFFEKDMLTIDTELEGDRGVLREFCVEGASLLGNYKLAAQN